MKPPHGRDGRSEGSANAAQPQGAAMPHVEIDFEALDAQVAYKLLAGTIVPRPIALVTTVSASGIANAAPYSFFNVLCADPPLVALGLENRPDGTTKDTAHNIEAREEFTVNIVSDAIAGAMAACAGDFDYEVDELEQTGLTAAPGKKVSSPYILEAPAAFECRRFVTFAVSRSRNIVIGRIVHAHYRGDILDLERMRVNGDALDAVGRLTGRAYTRTRDKFEL